MLVDDMFLYMRRDGFIDAIDWLMLAHAYRPVRRLVLPNERGRAQLCTAAYYVCHEPQLVYVRQGMSQNDTSALATAMWAGFVINESVNAPLLARLTNVAKYPLFALPALDYYQSVLVIGVCILRSALPMLETVYEFGGLLDPGAFFTPTVMTLSAAKNTEERAWLRRLLERVRNMIGFHRNGIPRSKETLHFLLEKEEWAALDFFLEVDDVVLIDALLWHNSAPAMRLFLKQQSIYFFSDENWTRIVADNLLCTAHELLVGGCTPPSFNFMDASAEMKRVLGWE